MTDDAHLLRQYVEARSQAAFAELVQRHLNLVYYAAVRQLGAERHLAEDVAQSVFVLLAEKSPTLLGHPSLAGWLHTATHFKVGHVLRAERRRQARENEALAMSDLMKGETEVENWEQIRPVLDQVLLELNARDREAVLLRYFENRAFADIAARLRVTEGAAHKCVERAVERLRFRLARRGVTSTAGALGVVLAQQGAFAAPAGLAASVAGAVAASSGPLTTTVGGALTFMSLKTTTGVAALVVLLAGGIATYEATRQRAASDALLVTEQETARLSDRLRAEEARIARERAAPAATAPASARPVSTAQATYDAQLAEGNALLAAHPELRAALLANIKAKIRYQYAEWFATEGLTEAEIEQFVALKANGRSLMKDDYVLRAVENSMPAGEATRRLKELLGEERYQRMVAFDESVAPEVTSEIVRMAYYTPAPLSPTQIAQFRRLLQNALDDRSLAPRQEYGVLWRMPMPVWEDVLRRADTVLAPAQVDALRDLYRQAKFNYAFSAAVSAYHKKND